MIWLRRLGYLAAMAVIAAVLIGAAVIGGDFLGDRLGGTTVDPDPMPTTIPEIPTSEVDNLQAEVNREQYDALVTVREWHEVRALIYPPHRPG
jgi:hypothetical protein